MADVCAVFVGTSSGGPNVIQPTCSSPHEAKRNAGLWGAMSMSPCGERRSRIAHVLHADYQSIDTHVAFRVTYLLQRP